MLHGLSDNTCVAMLLCYLTTYVSKSQDATLIDSMYSLELQGRHATLHY